MSVRKEQISSTNDLQQCWLFSFHAIPIGGGVRRQETIDPDQTYAPFLRHDLAKRGTLFTDMRISSDSAADADPAYRDNTIFVIVPDCGRDNNRYMAIPFQRHFNSASSREIFALLVGPGIARHQLVDRSVQQIALAPTIGQLMGFRVEHADAPYLRRCAEALQ